jgi:hypothetical protein
MAGWRRRSDDRPRMSRPAGCLLWLIAVLVILIAAAILFGGFQQGTKAAGSPRPPGQTVSSLLR